MGNVFVLFEVSVKKENMDIYLQLAASLKEELSRAEGFIRSERFSSLTEQGKLLSLSVWKSEECVAIWRNLAQHRMCQKQGRKTAFADYRITVLTPVRNYSMKEHQGMPEDSCQTVGA